MALQTQSPLGACAPPRRVLAMHSDSHRALLAGAKCSKPLLITVAQCRYGGCSARSSWCQYHTRCGNTSRPATHADMKVRAWVRCVLLHSTPFPAGACSDQVLRAVWMQPFCVQVHAVVPVTGTLLPHCAIDSGVGKQNNGMPCSVDIVRRPCAAHHPSHNLSGAAPDRTAADSNARATSAPLAHTSLVQPRARALRQDSCASPRHHGLSC